MKRVLAVLVVTLFASACASSTSTPTPAPSNPVMLSPSPEAQPAVQAVVADAAAHLGISPDQIQVQQVESRQWPDSSLGCPQPGQMYSQIVTPGYLIVISGAGKRLEYHTNTRSEVVLCQES
jgi:hypothetical protein